MLIKFLTCYKMKLKKAEESLRSISKLHKKFLCVCLAVPATTWQTHNRSTAKSKPYRKMGFCANFRHKVGLAPLAAASKECRNLDNFLFKILELSVSLVAILLFRKTVWVRDEHKTVFRIGKGFLSFCIFVQFVE